MSEKQKQIAREHMTTHGMSYSSEYSAWRGAKTRCRNPKNPSYKNYGGRGITFSEKWNKFENFLKDMGLKPSKKHTLERIDNSIGYSPENCRWATRNEQNRNHRRNVVFNHNGKKMCLMDWSKKTGINYNTLKARLFTLGWDFEKAITKKVNSPK